MDLSQGLRLGSRRRGGLTSPTVPNAPFLAATAGDGQITLSWTDGSANGAAITSHKLYRGTSAGSLTLLGTITTASPYVDTGLTNGTTYYYQLSAVNSVGEGSRSSTQNATPEVAPAVSLFGPVGYNLGNSQLEYYGAGFPFLDHFKSSEWRYNGGAGPIVLNADQYPTAIPAGASSITALVNIEGPLGPAGVLQRYVLKTNKLDMVFTLDNATFTGITDNTSGGVREYAFTVVSPNQDPKQGTYRLDIIVSSLPTAFGTGDYIKVVRADQEAALDAGGYFKPEFIARCQTADYLRMMDLQATNNNIIRSWAARPKVSWGSWTGTRGGVPLEVLIELCNQADRHGYFNIPVQIGTTDLTFDQYGKPATITQNYAAEKLYTQNMAALVRDNLNSHLRCGIEYGNENWNTFFPQYYYCAWFLPDLLPESPAYDKAFRQSGYRGTLLLGEWMKVFGYDHDRTMPLFCTLSVNSLISDTMRTGALTAMSEWADVGNVAGNRDDELAARYQELGQLYTGGLGITMYFHAGIGHPESTAPDKATVLGWANDVTSAGINAAIQQLDTGDVLVWGDDNSLSGFEAAFAPQFAFAQANQIPWYIYEGNIELPSASGNSWPPDTVEAPSPEDVLSRDFYNRVFDATGMRTLFAKMLRGVRALGGYSIDILAELGARGDTYATLNSAYGAITQRGLAVADFRAAPGSYPALSVALNAPGATAVGVAGSQRAVTTGGLGRVDVTVTGLPPGFTFNGFRTIAGTYETAGTYTITVTATDEAGNTATDTQVQTVSAAPTGKRYFRLRSIGVCGQPTSNTLALGFDLTSLTEITFYNGATPISWAGWTTSGDQFNTGEGHANLIDGSNSTIWTGAGNKTNLNLFNAGAGNAAQPTSIVMRDRSDLPARAPGDFAWDWSDDGTTWTEIYRTIIRGGATPGNAYYDGSIFTGSYPGGVITITPVYP
jgi:hypothetical protein